MMKKAQVRGNKKGKDEDEAALVPPGNYQGTRDTSLWNLSSSDEDGKDQPPNPDVDVIKPRCNTPLQSTLLQSQ